MRLPLIIALAAGAAQAQSPGFRATTVNEQVETRQSAEIPMNRTPPVIWKTVTEGARGRIRTDVVEGTQPGIPAGQITLLDTADIVFLHPDSKTFTRLNIAAQAKQVDQIFAQTGMTRSQTIESSVDSTKAIESMSGELMMRYAIRVTTKTTVSAHPIDLPNGESIAIGDATSTSTTTQEYWYNIGGPDESPLPPSRPPPPTEVGRRMQEALSHLPRKRAVVVVMTSRVESSSAAGAKVVTERRIATRNAAYESVTIDGTRLVIPADYTEQTTPGATPADAAWLERWRKPPG